MKERIQEIDIAKGIGILLVIIGHLLPNDSTLHIWIYSFHMPLFFILTGLVMDKPKSISFNSLLKKNINLIVNYFFWSLIYFIFDFIIRFLILKQSSFHSMFWDGYQIITFYGINVLWFFSTLFFAKIITCFILNKLEFKDSIISVIILFIISVCLSAFISEIELTNYNLLFLYPIIAIIRPLSAVIFLTFGYILKIVVRKMLKNMRRMMSLFLGVFFISITVACTFIVGRVDIHILQFGNSIIFLVSSFCGFFGVMCFCKLIVVNKTVTNMLKFLGINSSFIMVTHEYFMIKDLLSIFLNSINANILIYTIIEVVLLVLIEMYICKIFSRYYNKIINNIIYFLTQKHFN